MTKSFRKAIMLRSKLKNNFNKQRSDENWDNYQKQRNFCVKLLRQTKEIYFSNINVKSISDNKKFWKTIKAFSNKGPNTNNTMLVVDNKIVREEEIIANIMNNYFTNTTHRKLKPTRIDFKANLERYNRYLSKL